LLYVGSHEANRLGIWAWDGGGLGRQPGWDPVGDALEPAGRRLVAWDTGRNTIVLLTYLPGRWSAPAQIWEWDGAAWRAAAPAGPMGESPGFAYDPLTQSLALFRGDEQAPGNQGLWLLDRRRDARPALVFSPSLASMEVPFSAVTRLQAFASAGGADSGANPGFELLAWDARRGAWSDPLAVSEAGPDPPRLLEATLVEPDQIRALYLERDERMYFALAPFALSSAAAVPRLDVDYVALSLRYALGPIDRGCTNGVDDDGDTWIDGLDCDCCPAAGCACEGREDCENGVDDDGDTWIDASDCDCCPVPGCACEEALP
jgi:hypothetical protein